MARKPSIADLTAQVEALRPYEELFYIRTKQEAPLRFDVFNPHSDEMYTIELWGAGRASGGVIVEGLSVTWATEWCARVSTSACPYRRGAADQVRAAQKAAYEKAKEKS